MKTNLNPQLPTLVASSVWSGEHTENCININRWKPSEHILENIDLPGRSSTAVVSYQREKNNNTTSLRHWKSPCTTIHIICGTARWVIWKYLFTVYGVNNMMITHSQLDNVECFAGFYSMFDVQCLRRCSSCAAALSLQHYESFLLVLNYPRCDCMKAITT